MPGERSAQGTSTMIPLPRSGQYSSGGRRSLAADSKVAKTEKNRLRLIMQTRRSQEHEDGEEEEEEELVVLEDDEILEEDVARKERRIGSELDAAPRRPAKPKKTTIPRYRAKVRRAS